MRATRRNVLAALAASTLIATPLLSAGLALAETDPGSFTRDGSKNRFFRGLDAGLAFYRTIEREGGWPAIPEGKALAAGVRDPRVPVLRQRLSITGDYIGTETDSDLFDAELKQAVIAYQNRNGMEADGVAGPKTVADMNVPVRTRIKQMEINRERWNRMPAALGERFVLVNMAGYELDVVEGETTVLTMKVIVGKGYTETPMFSDTIQYIEFNPYWNVPRSIATKELVPEYVEKGIGAAEAQGFEVKRGDEVLPMSAVNWNEHLGATKLPFLIRQRPGPANALGEMKFMFPNKNNVYLHDTNQRHLFAKTKRAFSHGCVRVEKPHELAAYLLAPNTMETGRDWSLPAVNDVVASKAHTTVPLKRQVPVHLAYMTAWMDEQGFIQFRPDIYGRDAILQSELYPDGKAGGDPLAAEMLAAEEAEREAAALAGQPAAAGAEQFGATGADQPAALGSEAAYGADGDLMPPPDGASADGASGGYGEPNYADPNYADPAYPQDTDALGSLIDETELPPVGE